MSVKWVDVFNGPHVNFFQHVDQYLGDVHFTARDYFPIPEMIQLYGLDATVIGTHGGKSLYEKLMASSQRIMDLGEHIHRLGDIELLVNKHSVEAARVAWGLGIPSISFLDNTIMAPQNMLVCPLSNVVIAPNCIGHDVLRSFTPGHVRVLQFDGVSEVASMYMHRADESVLETLGLDTRKPIVVFRSSPLLAAYHEGGDVSLEEHIINTIRSQIQDVQIVHMRRSGEKPNEHPVIDARSLFHFADIVISGGGSMTREAAVIGTNAISYFETPLAVDRYLVEKGLLSTFPGREVLRVDWKRELRRARKKPDLDQFEHPFGLLDQAMRLL